MHTIVVDQDLCYAPSKRFKMDPPKIYSHDNTISCQNQGEPRLTTEQEEESTKSVAISTTDVWPSSKEQKMTGAKEQLLDAAAIFAQDLNDDDGHASSSLNDNNNNMHSCTPEGAGNNKNDTPQEQQGGMCRTPSQLTLSAYRRPENTVRLACYDSSRTIETKYDIQHRLLGHGAFSTVRLAMRRDNGEPVAVKTIAKHQVLRSRRHHRKSRREEWELLQELESNPHIVTPVDVFETDEDIQLVLEYCDGGELFDVIQSHRDDARAQQRRYEFPEEQASVIAAHVLTALEDLSSRGMAHRDVKPENILLKSTHEGDVCAKLSDFGTARCFHHDSPLSADSASDSDSDGEDSPCTPPSRTRTYSSVGSDYYTAPEVCAGEKYGTAVDIYSLGVTLYVLLCGVPPSLVEDSEGKETPNVDFPYWSHLSFEAKDLLRRMLHPDPWKRIAPSLALSHQWIASKSHVKLRMVRGRFQCLEDDLELVRSHLAETKVSSTARAFRKRPSFTLSVSDCEGRTTKRSSFTMGSDHQGSMTSSSEHDTVRVEAGALITSAMAKLYEGVAAAAKSASEAAACVVFDTNDGVNILGDEENTNSCEDEAATRATSPLESSLTALSV